MGENFFNETFGQFMSEVFNPAKQRQKQIDEEIRGIEATGREAEEIFTAKSQVNGRLVQEAIASLEGDRVNTLRDTMAKDQATYQESCQERSEAVSRLKEERASIEEQIVARGKDAMVTEFRRLKASRDARLNEVLQLQEDIISSFKNLEKVLNGARSPIHYDLQLQITDKNVIERAKVFFPLLRASRGD